jgi:hypothetical protein
MDLHLRCLVILQRWVLWMGQGGDGALCGGAEMGANLPGVNLGSGRSAVVVYAGSDHTCALLVRCRGEGCRLMMMLKGRGAWSAIPDTEQSHTRPLREGARICSCAACVRER